MDHERSHAVISFAVMAIRERSANVEALREALGDVPVSFDDERRGTWWNWRAAWSLRTATATHHCVLQDDIILSSDFLDAIEELVDELPGHAISGFAPQVTQPPRPGRKWCPIYDHTWTQCLVLPVSVGDMAIQWLAANEGMPRKRPWNGDDDRLTAFLKHAKVPRCMAVPCIVQHGLFESSLGHPRHVAEHWVGT